MQSSERTYSHCLYLSSVNLARVMDILAQKTWKPLGLKPSQAYALLLLVGQIGVQPSILAKQLLLSLSAITRLVENLEKQGWVYKLTYRHATLVCATDKAQKISMELWNRQIFFYRKCQQLLGKTLVTDLVTSMNGITDRQAYLTSNFTIPLPAVPSGASPSTMATYCPGTSEE